MTDDGGADITSGYILDRVTVQPGRLGEYRERVAREYLPLARERGMELVGSWIAPPLELHDESNDLYLLWSFPEFWTMKRQSREQGAAAWWEDSAELTVTRERLYLAAAELETP